MRNEFNHISIFANLACFFFFSTFRFNVSQQYNGAKCSLSRIYINIAGA